MVDTLCDRDRFLIYAFDDVIELPAGLEGGLIAATDRNRFRAVEFLAKIQARGGTEMAQPLERAVQALASEVRSPSAGRATGAPRRRGGHGKGYLRPALTLAIWLAALKALSLPGG